jgi:hypothetical protein
MDMSELLTEFLKSNNRNDDNRRPHHHQSIGKLNSYLLDMVREEKKLKMKRALPKPQSKYHK